MSNARRSVATGTALLITGGHPRRHVVVVRAALVRVMLVAMVYDGTRRGCTPVREVHVEMVLIVMIGAVGIGNILRRLV